MKILKILLPVFCVLLVAASDVPMKHLQLTKAPGESEFPDLASDGGRLAAAWMEGRDGNMEIYVNSADMDILASGNERRITSTPQWDDHPKLIWNGTEYALAWTYERKTMFDLKFLRLDRDLKPKGKAITLVANEYLGKDSQLCWSGAGYGVVYSKFEDAGQADIYFKFVTEEGKSMDAPVALTSGPGVKIPAALLRSGSDFVLVYYNETKKDCMLTRVDPFGRTRGDDTRLNLEGTQCLMPDGAESDNLLLAAWPQETTQGTQIMVLALTTGGDPAGVPSPVTQPGANRPAVSLASNKDSFGLAYIEVSDEGRSMFFLPLNRQGAVAGAPTLMAKPREVSVLSDRMDIVETAGGYTIAWVDKAPPANTEVILSWVNLEQAMNSAPPPPAPPETNKSAPPVETPEPAVAPVVEE